MSFEYQDSDNKIVWFDNDRKHSFAIFPKLPLAITCTSTTDNPLATNPTALQIYFKEKGLVIDGPGKEGCSFIIKQETNYDIQLDITNNIVTKGLRTSTPIKLAYEFLRMMELWLDFCKVVFGGDEQYNLRDIRYTVEKKLPPNTQLLIRKGKHPVYIDLAFEFKSPTTLVQKPEAQKASPPLFSMFPKETSKVSLVGKDITGLGEDPLTSLSNKSEGDDPDNKKNP